MLYTIMRLKVTPLDPPLQQPMEPASVPNRTTYSTEELVDSTVELPTMDTTAREWFFPLDMEADPQTRVNGTHASTLAYDILEQTTSFDPLSLPSAPHWQWEVAEVDRATLEVPAELPSRITDPRQREPDLITEQTGSRAGKPTNPRPVTETINASNLPWHLIEDYLRNSFPGWTDYRPRGVRMAT